jgi:hypothetical protein
MKPELCAPMAVACRGAEPCTQAALSLGHQCNWDFQTNGVHFQALHDQITMLSSAPICLHSYLLQLAVRTAGSQLGSHCHSLAHGGTARMPGNVFVRR